MLHLRLAVPAAGLSVGGTAPVFAQPAPTQLDRIEQKLDTILHRLDQMPPGQADGTQPTVSAAAPSLSSASEILAGGCPRHHSRRTRHANPAQEIPPDSVGGFIDAGGPLQLADLTDHGVRYAGLTGVEWQDWLRAKEAGRYQLDIDGSTVSPNNYTLSTCVFAGWLQDRSIGMQEAKPRANLSQPAAFSLILGAELQPGLYKLRLWATCTPTPSVRDQRVSLARWKKHPPISTCARSPARILRTSNAD
jgi:hypothetical protein